MLVKTVALHTQPPTQGQPCQPVTEDMLPSSCHFALMGAMRGHWPGPGPWIQVGLDLGAGPFFTCARWSHRGQAQSRVAGGRRRSQPAETQLHRKKWSPCDLVSPEQAAHSCAHKDFEGRCWLAAGWANLPNLPNGHVDAVSVQ